MILFTVGEKNFTSFRAVAEAKSFSDIYEIGKYWRMIMESSDSYISSIRDKKLQNELYVE